MRSSFSQLAAVGLLCSTASICNAQATAARGERLYADNCSTCHGEELQNNSTVAFDLRRLKADEHERFVTSVTNGKNAMPSWDGVLSDQDKEDLWAYIRANANDR
ncbi:MAG: cytochrome c like protein [Hyphomicrobiales bacterium]|nr:cytochrome c like protein [Hyphomicrobiales bacterium]